jgi:hypothetical protein
MKPEMGSLLYPDGGFCDFFWDFFLGRVCDEASDKV